MWSLMPRRTRDFINEGKPLSSVLDRGFFDLHTEFDTLLQRMSKPNALGINVSPWSMDVIEEDARSIVRLVVPGFEVEDFSVEVTGEYLTVKAEHKESQDDKKRSSYRFGKFERLIPLPEGAVTEGINARYHSGVLELQIPKHKEAKKVKRIAVTS